MHLPSAYHHHQPCLSAWEKVGTLAVVATSVLVSVTVNVCWPVVPKADHRIQDLGLETKAQEIDILYKLTDKWGVSTGVRDDLRIDRSPLVPLTQEQGDRKDAVVQVEYDSRGRWSAYGFVQDTVSATGDPHRNERGTRNGLGLLLTRCERRAQSDDE